MTGSVRVIAIGMDCGLSKLSPIPIPRAHRAYEPAGAGERGFARTHHPAPNTASAKISALARAGVAASPKRVARSGSAIAAAPNRAPKAAVAAIRAAGSVRSRRRAAMTAGIEATSASARPKASHHGSRRESNAIPRMPAALAYTSLIMSASSTPAREGAGAVSFSDGAARIFRSERIAAASITMHPPAIA